MDIYSSSSRLNLPLYPICGFLYGHRVNIHNTRTWTEMSTSFRNWKREITLPIPNSSLLKSWRTSSSEDNFNMGSLSFLRIEERSTLETGREYFIFVLQSSLLYQALWGLLVWSVLQLCSTWVICREKKGDIILNKKSPCSFCQ